ncbi:DUF362 domain-containing protein [candidate division KSB1 bacterium]
MKGTITRRDFMKGSAYVALGAAAGFPLQSQKETRVVLIRNEHVWNGETELDGDIIQRMLDQAVTTLLGTDTPQAAFRTILKPEDTVGIKTNVWNFLPTPKELESAIKRRVLDAGVREDRIGIADRGLLNNPLFTGATALINVRPMRTHYWSGVGGCLKNLITFTPRPDDYHNDSCADMALFWKLPVTNGKTRLNILSMLNPLFHGRGPHHFDRRYIWKYNGIIAGIDPVAVDTVGLEIINAKRLEFFGRRREFQTSPKHIMMADVRHGLGTSDLNKIELIKLGWNKDILI